MLTKNFYNQVAALLTKKDIRNGLISTTGEVRDAPWNVFSAMSMLGILNNLTIGEVGSGVRIGSGDTPATADDYTLESVIASGCSVVNQSATTVTKEGDNVSAYATSTISNTGTTALSISEIGLFSSIPVDGVGRPFLLDRTVLESPITINPGEAKSITYTIRMNYPTA